MLRSSSTSQGRRKSLCSSLLRRDSEYTMGCSQSNNSVTHGAHGRRRNPDFPPQVITISPMPTFARHGTETSSSSQETSLGSITDRLELSSPLKLKIQTAISAMECPVCMDTYNSHLRKPCTLPCGHSLCLNHVPLLKRCPICRKSVPPPGSGGLEKSVTLIETSKAMKELLKCLLSAPPECQQGSKPVLNQSTPTLRDVSEVNDGLEEDEEGGETLSVSRRKLHRASFECSFDQTLPSPQQGTGKVPNSINVRDRQDIIVPGSRSHSVNGNAKALRSQISARHATTDGSRRRLQGEAAAIVEQLRVKSQRRAASSYPIAANDGENSRASSFSKRARKPRPVVARPSATSSHSQLNSIANQSQDDAPLSTTFRDCGHFCFRPNNALSNSCCSHGDKRPLSSSGRYRIPTSTVPTANREGTKGMVLWHTNGSRHAAYCSLCKERCEQHERDEEVLQIQTNVGLCSSNNNTIRNDAQEEWSNGCQDEKIRKNDDGTMYKERRVFVYDRRNLVAEDLSKYNSRIEV